MSNNTSGFIGVSYRKDRDRFDPEIRKDDIRCHLGYTKTLEEAVYKRYIAEKIVFGEYANELEQKTIVTPSLEENLPEPETVEQAAPQQKLPVEENDDANHNEKILALCRQGMSDVEIARTLGLGLGEVRLVIGLYKGEQTSEV